MSKLDLLLLRQHRNTWKEPVLTMFDDTTRRKYSIRKIAVDLYIDGLSPKQISEQIGVSASEIIRLVRKCIIQDENGNSVGYNALIPNRQTTHIEGVLGRLFLKYPLLEEYVIGNYFGDKKYTLERNMSIRTLHSKFLDECKRLGIQDYEYPFSIKDKGYYVLYKYIQDKKLELPNRTIQRENSDAKQKFLFTGYGTSFNLNALAPYNIVQIDGHKIDMLYTVQVENKNGELIDMPATRCWLIALIDTATRAIIGYSLSQHENYNQTDVLNAIHNSIVPHKKMDFQRKSLKYPENGGFPSLVLPETEWATFDMIMLDNAKAHLAENVTRKLTENLKATVSFGSVATPETRGIIERFFNTIEQQGFHRLPGTTGSNINDPKRNKPEEESVRYRITYNDIQELIEYFIAEYNNSAHSSLENQTPLQVMERRVRQAGMLPCIIPPAERPSVVKLTYFLKERTLRGGYKTGSRPHLSYLGVKYHAHDTMIPMEYVGKKVYIEVNPADVSHVDLYDKNGIFLANLVAMGEWGKKPHSLKTHKAALERKNKNLENNTLFTPHLTNFEKELRETGKKRKRDRTIAAIARNEMGIDLNKKPAPVIKITDPVPKPKEEGFTKEEIDLLNSMSIEEAFKKGLI